MATDSSCVFCRILAGSLPGSFVHRDELVSAFLDIHPINRGHVLIVPNQHYARFNQVPGSVAAKMFEVAQKIHQALPRANVKMEGANFFLSDGEVAGQEVPHSHLHIAPRFTGDGHRMGFSNTAPDAAARENLDSLAKELRSSLSKSNYEIRELTAEEFRPLFQEYAPRIFDDNELILRPFQVMSDEEKIQLEELRKKFQDPFRINLGLFKGSEFVGWSWGYQDSPESFYMVNSAILPEHRLQGHYTQLLEQMMSRIAGMGFQRIYSRHTQTNNSILIPKLKRGFQVTAFELSDIFGTLVHLTYFTNPTRRKVLEFRAGHLRPDEELRKLFNI